MKTNNYPFNSDVFGRPVNSPPDFNFLFVFLLTIGFFLLASYANNVDNISSHWENNNFQIEKFEENTNYYFVVTCKSNVNEFSLSTNLINWVSYTNSIWFSPITLDGYNPVFIKMGN